jgi:hypothetical protein
MVKTHQRQTKRPGLLKTCNVFYQNGFTENPGWWILFRYRRPGIQITVRLCLF